MSGEFSEGLFQPDGKKHFLPSENFGKTPKAVILVTGYPEGPNELAKSSKATLDAFFEKADEETAIAQVYTGNVFRPSDLSRLPEYLQYALDKAGNSRINLIVFSAGALSLMNLPEEYWQRIDSLTLISPLVGKGGIRDDNITSNFYRFAVFLTNPVTKIPTTDEYLKSIAPLVNNLREQGKPVEVILGEKDELINSRFVQKLFQEKFPGISIAIKPRGHAPSVDEIPL